MIKFDGGAAFPLTRESSFRKNYEGMTLRDWFAGQAMPALVRRGYLDKQDCAIHAFEYADAMIAERSKP